MEGREMKKKVLAMALAAVMVVASAMPAMAAGSNDSQRSGGSSSRGGSSKAEYTRDYKAGNGPSGNYWSTSGWGQTPGAWINNGNGTWSYGTGAGTLWAGTWIVNNGRWYYIAQNGVMVTGYQTINGVGYNFDASGALLNN